MSSIIPQQHWDRIYARQAVEQLGWYEPDPEPSLRLIDRRRLPREAGILVVGAGATTLIDILLDRGYEKLIATDISAVALDQLKQRLGPARGKRVRWVVDDLTQPSHLTQLPPVDLWHDRAVLHFFTEAADREIYFDLLRRLVRPGGYVILAAFHLQGADRCSGLPVYRYDERLLSEQLGPEFRLLECFPHDYHMPSGEQRLYIYTLFQRP